MESLEEQLKRLLEQGTKAVEDERDPLFAVLTVVLTEAPDHSVSPESHAFIVGGPPDIGSPEYQFRLRMAGALQLIKAAAGYAADNPAVLHGIELLVKVAAEVRAVHDRSVKEGGSM